MVLAMFTSPPLLCGSPEATVLRDERARNRRKCRFLGGDDLLGNRRNGWGLTGGQLRGELGAGANAELAIDLREVPLNRLGADEQGVRDLAVRASRSDEGSDSFLGRRKHAGCCGYPSADPSQLGVSLFGPQ